MTSESLHSVDTDLGAAIAGFEMEISDSVIKFLLTSIAACIEEKTEDSDLGMLLTAMDSVARYVDSLRSQADPAACGLVEELGMAYMQICSGGKDAKESRTITAAIIKKVIQWQQSMLQQKQIQQQQPQDAKDEVLPGAVLSLVEQNITETNKFVQQEIEALKSSVGALSLNESFRKAALDQQISSAVEEQVQLMQNLLSEELGKLRKELQPASKQV